MSDSPSPPAGSLEVRSYRTVFDLERRVYRIDRLRLNPAGVPVRGVVYFLVLLTLTAGLARLPGVGSLISAVPWYVRDLGAPAGCAALLVLVRVEGRTSHLAAQALLTHVLAPRHLCGLTPGVRDKSRWRPPELVALADGSDTRLRHVRFTGPGAVLIAPAHERTEWRRGALGRALHRPQLTVSERPRLRAPRRAQVLELAAGVRLEVLTTRPSADALSPDAAVSRDRRSAEEPGPPTWTVERTAA